jgi:hypothetical protein
MFFKKKNAEQNTQNLNEKSESTTAEAPKVPQISQTKRIKKPKPIWDNKYKLVDVQFPQEINNPKFKKKYKLNITYKDDDKLHKKTIRFGKKDDVDYVEGGDLNKKNKISSKLGNTHNMFHGNFWRLHLLNGEAKSLKENYLNLISKI